MVSKLQKLQNRVARIVTNSPFDSSATSLIQDLGWPTINELIHRETSVMTYNCLNKVAPDYLSSCISKPSDRHSRELRNSATDLLIAMVSLSSFSLVLMSVVIIYPYLNHILLEILYGN